MEYCDGSACVELKIPCKPEYVGVARLAMLGVASRMKFTYDEVEDVRLAVGEACTTSVEWAQKNNLQDTSITVLSKISSEELVIDIYDESGKRGGEVEEGQGIPEPENLGNLLVTLLVDDVKVEMTENGTHVRMTKHAK